MKLTRFCSVAAPADVAGIRVLRGALDAHHPGARLTVAALPGALRELRAIDGVELAELDSGQLPVAEVRALLLERVLRDGAECALLLPADCDVRAPLSALEEALDRAEVAALARVGGPLPDDGERPDAADLEAAGGELDDELVAARRPPAAPLRAHAVTDPGYGVSAWNLHERPLSVGPDGAPRAAGRAIHLVRFAGFRPDRPWWLSESATRARVLDDPVLARLCRERARALLAAGWEPPARVAPHPDARVRRWLLEAADAGADLGDVRAPAGAAALRDWLARPVDGGLNHYTRDVWRSRDDLRRAFPDPGGADGDRFAEWLWTHGRAEMELDAELLPQARRGRLLRTVRRALRR